jgi:hypothetical protein
LSLGGDDGDGLTTALMVSFANAVMTELRTSPVIAAVDTEPFVLAVLMPFVIAGEVVVVETFTGSSFAVKSMLGITVVLLSGALELYGYPGSK